MYGRDVVAVVILCLPHLVVSALSLQWHEYKGRCYAISSVNATFDDAARACADEGMSLTEFGTEDELHFIQTVIEGSPYPHWVGLRRDLSDNEYHWINSRQIPSTTMWVPAEPNQTGLCARLLTEAMLQRSTPPPDPFRLADHLCDSEYRYICEKEADPHIVQGYILQSTSSEYRCPVQSIKVKSLVHCGRACAIDFVCNGFQYDNATRSCTLMEFAVNCSNPPSSTVISMYIMKNPRC